MTPEPDTAFSIDIERDNGQRQWQPVPRWLKLAGVGLAGVLVIVLFWIGMTRMHRPQPTSLADVESGLEAQTKPGSDLRSKAVTAVDLPSANAYDQAESSIASDTQSQPIAAANQPEAALAQDVTSLKTTVAEQTNQFELWQSEQTEQLHALQQQLTEQAMQLEQLTEQLKPNTPTKAKPVKHPRPKSLNHRKRRIKAKVPFALIGIDQWGDQTYAVLQHHGQWYEKTSGQNLLDWHIVSIDRDTQTLTIKNPQGHQQTLSIYANANQQKGRKDDH